MDIDIDIDIDTYILKDQIFKVWLHFDFYKFPTDWQWTKIRLKRNIKMLEEKKLKSFCTGKAKEC